MKNSLRFLAACTVLVCFAFALPTPVSKKINIVIDSGHGGKDHGAVHDSFTEKEIVNRVASKIKQLNKDKDVVIHFTRASDEFVTLEDRVEAINALKPDMVISLHVNYVKGSEIAQGMEFFVSDKAKEYPRSKELAGKLEEKFTKDKAYKSRGVKTAPFYILKNSEAPTVMMQLGFLSNADDRAYLTNEGKQEEMASVIMNFIKDLK